METLLENKSVTFFYGSPKHAGQRMSKANFLQWEPDDMYVYEFNKGVLEPTFSMRQDENYLLTNIENQFFKTASFQAGVRIRAEMDAWVTDQQMRRPNVSFYSKQQLQLIDAGSDVVPEFVIDFGSISDDVQKGLTKLHEYFDAGVQVVWWVYPLYKEVYVYTSPKNVVICTDDDVLNAAPALSDFQLTVAELFRK